MVGTVAAGITTDGDTMAGTAAIGGRSTVSRVGAIAVSCPKGNCVVRVTAGPSRTGMAFRAVDAITGSLIHAGRAEVHPLRGAVRRTNRGGIPPPFRPVLT